MINNNLDEIFDVSPTSAIDVDDVLDVEEDVIEDNIEDNEKYIEDEIRDIIQTAKEMLATAKYIIESAGDPDSISAGASIISSLSSIIRELNRGLLLEKRHMNTKEIENIKQKNKEKLLKMKLEAESNIPKLAPGSTLHLEQHNYNSGNNDGGIPYRQEQIVEKLLETLPKKSFMADQI